MILKPIKDLVNMVFKLFDKKLTITYRDSQLPAIPGSPKKIWNNDRKVSPELVITPTTEQDAPAQHLLPGIWPRIPK